jgi:hypothetical protein
MHILVRKENCFIQILGFQSEVLRMIEDAPWYMPNVVIPTDFQTPTVKEEISHYSSQYTARNRRLRRHLPNDLPTRFIV